MTGRVFRAALAALLGMTCMLTCSFARAEEGGGFVRQVTELSVSAGARSFRYLRTASGLSVNGHDADQEVFDTLLRQIVSASMCEPAAFTPEGDPLMTVSAQSPSGQRLMRFFADKQDQSRVYVLISGRGADEQGTTDAWRVGTILMACEGSQLTHEGEAP